jgi:prevent-host-death family protein
MPKDVEAQTVTATQFQQSVGAYMEKSATEPVIITKHQRPVRVLMGYSTYERLKALDTRKAYYAHELPEAWREALEKATFDHLDPTLDHLLEKKP